MPDTNSKKRERCHICQMHFPRQLFAESLKLFVLILANWKCNKVASSAWLHTKKCWRSCFQYCCYKSVFFANVCYIFRKFQNQLLESSFIVRGPQNLKNLWFSFETTKSTVEDLKKNVLSEFLNFIKVKANKKNLWDVIIKGQLISKGNFGVFNSPKKWTWKC